MHDALTKLLRLSAFVAASWPSHNMTHATSHTACVSHITSLRSSALARS